MTARKRPAKRPKNGHDHTVVLLEDLRSRMQFLADAIVGHKESTDREFAAVRSEMAERTSLLEGAIRELFGKFRTVDGRFDAIDTRFDAIDTRFDAMDARFDAMDARFDRVDGDLASLRQDGRELAALVARKADASALAALDQRVTWLERGART